MTINQNEAIRVLREALKDIRDYEGCMAAQNWPHVIDKAIAALAATSHIAPDAAVEADDDSFTASMLADLARRGASPAGLSLAAQLFGVGPCQSCGFRKLHCKCASPAIAPEASELPSIKTWKQRADDDSRQNKFVERINVYMEGEIADLRAAIAMHQSVSNQGGAAQGRTNAGDETSGTVARFGFDCSGAHPEIIPATNGAFVYYDDYVKLYQAAAEPVPTDLSKRLREYAAEPGYSHNDYADTMRQAVAEIDRLAAAEPAPAKPAITLTEEGIQFADGSAISKDGEITGPMAEAMARQTLAARKAAAMASGACKAERLSQLCEECCDAGLHGCPYVTQKAAAEPVPTDPWKWFADKAVDVLQRHIVPNGLTDKDALSELHGIFDGPEFRAMDTIPQMRCNFDQAQAAQMDRQTASVMAATKPAASEAGGEKMDQANVMPPFAAPADRLKAEKAAFCKSFDTASTNCDRFQGWLARAALSPSEQAQLAGSAKGGITNDSTANLAAPAAPTDAGVRDKLRDAVLSAWANYERMGEVCSFEGQPMIFASTLEELAEIAKSSPQAPKTGGSGE